MSLKDRWDSFVYNFKYGPFAPEEPVQEKLESLGYEFNEAVVAVAHYSAVVPQIKAPNGRLVSSNFSGDETSKTYFQDYENALIEVHGRIP